MKICSKHFRQRDFVNPHAKKRRLNRNAVPSKFSWTPVEEEEEEDVERTAVSKLECSRIKENEATDTTSEGDGDELRVSGLTLTLQKTQTYEDDFCDDLIDISFRVPCLHRFSLSLIYCLNVRHLRKNKKCFRISQDLTVTLNLWTCLNLFCLTSIENFLSTGIALLVNQVLLIQKKLFEENESGLEEDRDEDEPEIRETKTRPSAHKLQVEDEFLMVLMKLQMGLSNIDLGERFNV